MALTEPVRPKPVRPEPGVSRPARQFGYLIAIAVNITLLVVANNLLAWDLLSWLTDDFEQVLPLVNLSLVASILVNAVYLWHDHGWFRSLSQIGLAGIALAAIIQMYRVFPFDFSAYTFNWAAVTRAVLIVALVGTSVAIVVEVVKLVAGSSDRP